MRWWPQLWGAKEAMSSCPPCGRGRAHRLIFPSFPHLLGQTPELRSGDSPQGGDTEGMRQAGEEAASRGREGPTQGSGAQASRTMPLPCDTERPHLCLRRRRVPGPVGPKRLEMEGWNLPGPHQPTPLSPGQRCQPPSPGTPLWTGDFKV